jgi:hypothetical protein
MFGRSYPINPPTYRFAELYGTRLALLVTYRKYDVDEEPFHRPTTLAIQSFASGETDQVRDDVSSISIFSIYTLPPV